jgi:O-methyltransferase
MTASDPKALDALVDHFGPGITSMTALAGKGVTLPQALGDKHFRCILEIGTHLGLTAAILAEHADSVLTLDIVDNPIAEKVWDFFGVRHKIVRLVVRDDAEKIALVDRLRFDMAYVDACHDRGPVPLDFALVRRCGCVLFHDYPTAVPNDCQPLTGYRFSQYPPNYLGDGVGFLLDAVRPGGTIQRMPPFAWWYVGPQMEPLTLEQAIHQVKPYTCLSRERLIGLYEAIQTVNTEGIQGDIAECGVCLGGSAAMLALVDAQHRDLWLFDSFQGMPQPTAADPPEAKDHVGKEAGSVREVREFLNSCGVASPVTFVEGWYEQTLPCAEPALIAVLHVDCDWYASVKRVLETMWDKVVPGGFIQLDDYGHWSGARKAVDEFLAGRGIKPEFKVLDYTGIQLRKP